MQSRSSLRERGLSISYLIIDKRANYCYNSNKLNHTARLLRTAKKGEDYEQSEFCLYCGGSPCENYAANYLDWWKKHHRKRLDTGDPVSDKSGKVAINADKLRAFAAAVKVLKGE